MTEKMLVTATPPMQEEWKELEESELWELLTQLREVDPELYEDAVQRIPYLVKQNKLVCKSTQKTVKQLTKSAKQTKKYYYKLSKAIMKLIKRDDVAQELKLELIELLKELTIKMEGCDQQGQAALVERHKKTMGYGTLALMTIAAVYGVVTRQKSTEVTPNDDRS